MAGRSNPVTRASLIHRLGVEPRKRITLVEAPAGYGKTLFLTEWERTVRQRGVRTAFIPAPHLAGGEQALVGTVAKALPVHQAPGIATFRELLAALSVLTNPLILFLDDIERLDGAMLARISTLVGSASDAVRFVLAFAPPPPIALGRYAVAGQIARLTSEELLFGLDDVRRFLPPEVSDEDVVELHHLTGGWPLALSVLGGAEDRIEGGIAVLRSMVEQLLERQDMAVRTLLLAMAILPAFTVQHAIVLTGRNDAALVIDAARRGGFPLIHDADNNLYRYHGVVRDVLLDALRDDAGIDRNHLHARAAHWYISRNEPLEALRHALIAGDRTLTAAVIRLQGGDWPMGLVKGMAGLTGLASLPLASLADTPRLWIAAIYALIQNGDIAAADAQMRLIHALCRSDDAIFLAERDAMAILLRHYHDEPVLQRDVGPLAARCEGIRASPILANLIRNNLPMIAAADAGELYRARDLGDIACAGYRAEGAVLADVYTRLRTGQFALHQGEAGQALAYFRDVYGETTAHLHDAPHHLMGRLFIAEALQAQGEFGRAEIALDPVLAVIDRMEPWPPLIDTYYRVRARGALWRSHRATAVALLEQGQDHAHRIGATRLFLSLGLARAEIAASPDMLGHVEGILRGLCDEPGQERIFAPGLVLQAQLARARLTLTADPTSTMTDLARLAATAQGRGFGLIARSARLLCGLARAATRDSAVDGIDPELDDLREAGLDGLAMEELWVSGDALRLLPAGGSVVDHLTQWLRHAGSKRAPTASPAAASPTVSLSPRERDVLDLMLVGLSGNEMAVRLDLSESSVKSYRNALYRKFGVRQRSALIATVRASGLAPGTP